MTRLAVVADVHADDYGSKVDPATGLNARWVDSLRMLRWVANDARQRRADALIVAGDLTESRHPAPWRVAQIAEALEDFGSYPVKLLRGNHDGERDGRSIVDVVAGGRKGWEGFTRPGVTVVGDTAIAMLPYLDSHRLRALPEYSSLAPAEAFAALGEAFLSIARGLYVEASFRAERQVLVVHQGLGGGLMSDTQAAFLGDQSLVVDTRALAAIGFDAVLAGHFHRHQVLSEAPLIAYAGSPQRVDFGEQDQAKGYLLVDVDTDGTTGIAVPVWQFIETPARRFVTLDANEDGRITIAGGEVDYRDAIVRVRGLSVEGDPAKVREMLLRGGAFEVTEIRRRPVATPAVAGGLSEGLSTHQALAAYFADAPDAGAVVERGRGILEAVS